MCFFAHQQMGGRIIRIYQGENPAGEGGQRMQGVASERQIGRPLEDVPLV